MDLIIFGAQAIALGAYQALKNLYPQREIRCFLVSHLGNNPPVLEGMPVTELSAFARQLSQEEKDQIEILIATPENIMEEIEQALEHQGFSHHARLTSSRWSQLMSYHYLCGKEYLPLSALPVGCRKPVIRMFMAKFHKDKPLTEAYQLPLWITPIQVGAALCGERVAELLDSDGMNISVKNVNYSELTALYLNNRLNVF